MKRLRRQINRLVIASVPAISWLIAVQPGRGAEPEYNGKALSEWMVELEKTPSREEVQAIMRAAGKTGREEEIKACLQIEEQYRDAIRQIGTNGLPLLIDMVSITEKSRGKVVKKIKSKELREGSFRKPEHREALRGMAVEVFGILGTNAEPAIPQLTNLMYDLEVHWDVECALAQIGPKGIAALTNAMTDGDFGCDLVLVIGEKGGSDPETVTRFLINALKSPNPIIRENAAMGLLGKDAERVIPALLPLLEEKANYNVVTAAAHALSGYGAKAKIAVPKLLSIYTNAVVLPDRNEARNWGVNLMWALKAIDLEAARQAEEFLVNSGPLNSARFGYTRTMLMNGKELIVGGIIHTEIPKPVNRCLSSVELFDPKTGKWKETGNLNTARFDHKATLLPDGKVLVVNGSDIKNNAISSTELYDPATGTWTVITNK